MVETPDEHRKRLELQDYGHELAGLETGRVQRFGIGKARFEQDKEKRRKERAYRDALDRLLIDPQYRALYEELRDKLSAAETEADQAIDSIQAALAAQQVANQEMRDRAPKIDGKAVFRYADGRVVDEDGNEIDPALAAAIIWPSDAATADDYFAGMAREEALRVALAEWLAYRYGTLGEVRNRFEDRDNPMSKDDLEDAIEEIEKDAPDLPLEAAKPTEATQAVSHAPQALLTLDN